MIRQSCPPRVSSFREKRCVVENEHTGDQMSKFYRKTMFVQPEHRHDVLNDGAHVVRLEDFIRGLSIQR